MKKAKMLNKNIYIGFDKTGLSLDLQTWRDLGSLFSDLIEEVEPKLIIEVGSWKGRSAITMAKHLKETKRKAEIICVDTWLGNISQWDGEKPENISFSKDLNLKNGYPQLYYQFLYNVIESGVKEYITPFPTTSLIGSRYFQKKNIKADLIYIDGSHDYLDVKLDCEEYLKILNKGGVMFGDDYKFPEVKKAVNEFAKKNNLKLKILVNGAIWKMKGK